jgi:ADP-ribosylglycohydrolase
LPESRIKSSGYVVDTLEAAVWCLLTTDSFEKALLRAVNLGDDTDTVGAVAGGLAGLYYGYEAIPEGWLSEIKKRDWIEKLCS